MKNSRTNIIRVFAAVLFAALVMVDIHVEIEHPISWDNTELSLTVQNAEAQVVHDFYMSTTTCWVDGKEISICRAGDGRCNVSAQGCCSETDPCHSET